MSEEAKTNRLKFAVELREKRKLANKPIDELIRDFRVYYVTLPERALYPYDYQYVEIFYNLLKRKGLMCPTYHHLYIEVEKTIEDCLLRSIPHNNRMVYGISVIDYDNYISLPETGRSQIVFEIISSGLKDIADLDKLDKDIINKTIEDIKIKRLDTELEHIAIENGKHNTTITYFSRSLEDGCPIYLNIFEKATNKSVKILIGTAAKDVIYHWINTMAMNKTDITIKSRASAKSDLYLEDKPRSMKFNINELLK